MLALTPRERWDRAPPGDADRDWFPWRYRRLLSLVARPIVELGDDAEAPLLWYLLPAGRHPLRLAPHGVLHNPGSAELSWQRRGEAGPRLHGRSGGGTEIPWMGSSDRSGDRELGAPKDLGDLDVVAWHPGDPRLAWIVMLDTSSE
jgi:hypothetical protein